ncbi:hypothetical protein WJX84_001055 [Apatococcus fuscideae]|uniref:Uncharacterized protein n=1 Tax=Apatococcus fuscideae TaxID=2026836 RepID=A0AAW1SUB0_9CHLO
MSSNSVTSFVTSGTNSKVTADAANRRPAEQKSRSEPRNLTSQPVAFLAAGGFAAFVCWKVWSRCHDKPDGSRAGSKRAKADRQTRDEETAIDGNKKAAHKAEMQRRKEKRDRHLDKAGNASKDSKQDDGQTAILNFSYYDNKP